MTVGFVVVCHQLVIVIVKYSTLSNLKLIERHSNKCLSSVGRQLQPSDDIDDKTFDDLTDFAMFPQSTFGAGYRK